MAKLFLTTVAISVAVALPALAQTPPKPALDVAAMAERFDAVRQASKILYRAKAEDVFAFEPEGKAPGVRHTLSGMRCVFEPNDETATILIFAREPRGSDVSCTGRTEGMVESSYATRFLKPLSLDEAFALYEAEIREVHPDVKPYRGGVISFGVATDVPQMKTGYYQFTDKTGAFFGKPGAKVLSRLAVSVVNGWVLEQRITSPHDNTLLLSGVGEINMLTMVTDVRDYKGDVEPVSAAPWYSPPPSSPVTAPATSKTDTPHGTLPPLPSPGSYARRWAAESVTPSAPSAARRMPSASMPARAY